MPAPDACLALIRQTADYLCTHHTTFPEGRVTQLTASAAVQDAVRFVDDAALSGDAKAVKVACRKLILTWKQLLT